MQVEAAVLTPINVKLLGVGNSQVRYGAYAGLYQLELNGSPSSILAMCDDSLTSVYVGETWTANKFTYSEIKAGAPVKFASEGIKKYSQAGYLFSLINSVSFSDQADINLAVWNIMSPSSIAMTYKAESFYNTAISGVYDDFNYSNVMNVLTPNPLDASQEYLVSAVPLPESIWLFGSGIIGIVGISRKKRL